MSITEFMDKHFHHFNARETVDSARAWKKHLEDGGEMMLAMGGAMSTAELGISLAEMIRQDKVHIICTTGANLEEDVFNLFAHDEYEIIKDWRALSADDEQKLLERGFNRVTDTCIPESVMRHTENILIEMWAEASKKGESFFPWEYVYKLLGREDLREHYQIPPEHSWVLAAREKNIPILTPGWEDSTLGNIFTARTMQGVIKSHHAIRSGTEQMEFLTNWYRERVKSKTSVGFFQIAGGISGDFPICAVPMLIQDLKEDVPLWGYFAQISDSTTSYGSYSGAVPNEKITWCKIAKETPKFMINSDASIVAPLIFEYVLGK